MNRSLLSILGVLVFCFLAYFPLFFHLDTEPLKQWDESLFGLRALYLAENGEILNNFGQFDKAPGHPNTKPPLISFVQVIFMKVLGYNELALRLPIALFGLLLMGIFYWFSLKEWGKPGIGLLGGLALLTSTQFVQPHMVRSADHDVPLSVFAFLSIIFLYRYLKNDQKKFVHLALLTLMVGFGVLTKNLFGLLFLPGFFLYFLYKRQLIPFLTSGRFVGSLGILAGLLGGFYIVWEIQNPGIMNRIWEYEILKRYTTALENHEGSIFYYVSLWIEGGFMPWVLFIPITFGLLFIEKYKAYHDFIVITAFCFFITLIAISLGSTKTVWYSAVLYPILGIWTGISLNLLLEGSVRLLKPLSIPKIGIITLELLLLFGIPYYHVMENILKEDYVYPQERYGHFMNQHARVHPSDQDYKIHLSSWDTHAIYYVNAFNSGKGFNLGVNRDPSGLKVGQKVLVCTQKDFNRIKKRFKFDKVREYKDCTMVLLKEKIRDTQSN
ncbi:MAG: glycosyltransferase family 39 protein [Bacteroidota bacterium]